VVCPDVVDVVCVVTGKKIHDVWRVVRDALVKGETLRCYEDLLPALFIKTMLISEQSNTILFRVYYAAIHVEFRGALVAEP
jgi:hypothetical protein